ncbi:MAG TPA: biotin--protein ligase [Thermomicrobiales bacterium]|nr:biotin--protein ligase [Thermomicrobiales bacterium]
MHGEYKTPGGKLVIVDFTVDDHRLREVMVSGDFFLYPEEALATIDAALEGLDSSLSQDEYAERVRLQLGPDVSLIGTSPEGIAIAVRRALDGFTRD